MPLRLINVAKVLTSAQNNQMLELYTPSIIDGHQLDGVIWDFFVHIEFKSITELGEIPLPDGSGLMTKEELRADFKTRTENSPAKVLSLYYEVNGVTVPATKVLCYRQDPSYQEEMLQYLTTKSKVGLAFGTKLKATIEPFNNGGLLGDGDIVSFWLVIEETKNLDVEYLATEYLTA